MNHDHITGKIDVGVVEQKHLHLTTVVSIDDTGTGVNEVLRSETATRSHAAI